MDVPSGQAGVALAGQLCSAPVAVDSSIPLFPHVLSFFGWGTGGVGGPSFGLFGWGMGGWSCFWLGLICFFCRQAIRQGLASSGAHGPAPGLHAELLDRIPAGLRVALPGQPGHPDGLGDPEPADLVGLPVPRDFFGGWFFLGARHSFCWFKMEIHRTTIATLGVP